MAEMLRQDWAQAEVWQASPGYWLAVKSMTIEQIGQAMADINQMPSLSGIVNAPLFNALKARGLELQAGNG